MQRRRSRTALMSIMAMLALAAPSGAIACGIAKGPAVRVPASERVAPIRHDSKIGAWGVLASWRSLRPEPLNTVQRSQRLITFISTHNFGARRWYDDTDPNTSCPKRGQQVYTAPRLIARQGERAVFVTFVTRRRADPAGCVSWAPGDAPLPGDQVIISGSCDDLAYGRIRLAKPIGDRNLVLVRFGSTNDDTTA